MKKNIIGLCIGLVALTLGGCAVPLPSVGPGGVFTDVKEAVQAVNDVAGSRRGEACGQNILGIVSTGDYTVEAAKRAAGITRVATIDRSYWSILCVYAKACTVVTGN